LGRAFADKAILLTFMEAEAKFTSGPIKVKKCNEYLFMFAIDSPCHYGNFALFSTLLSTLYCCCSSHEKGGLPCSIFGIQAKASCPRVEVRLLQSRLHVDDY